MIHIVLMAGGKGTRFWPVSREDHPKQFLNVDGELSLIEATLTRIEPLVPPSQRWLVGSYEHRHLFSSIAQLLPPGNLILEPVGRNTGPCMALAAAHINALDPDAVIIFLAADHHIQQHDAFRAQLSEAAATAGTTKKVVIIGIPPAFAFTGYGYIEVKNREQAPYSVNAFKEKPDPQTAEQYLKSGNYFWNSGIYVVHAASFFDLIAESQPQMAEGIRQFLTLSDDQKSGDAGYSVYKALPSLSIEHTAVEAHPEVLALYPAQFDWSDVGSWGALEDILPYSDNSKNITNCQTILVDSSKNIIYSKSKRLIAAVDIHNLIVVDTPDALLIMPKNADQKVKSVVDQLPEAFR